jgi:hypothetical protein
MKEFFKISDSVEKKVIASAYPQVDVEGFEGFDLWGANSYTSTPLEGPINFSVVFPKLILQEHAILTDMLSSPIGSKYMMISERLFELFSKFTMDNYQYFTENVHTPKGSVAYKLLYLNTPRDDDFLDWKHCQFYDLNGAKK